MKKLSLLFVFLLSTQSFAALSGVVLNTMSVGGATSGSIILLPSNPLRKYLLVQNRGATDVILKFGSASSDTTDGIDIVSGGNYEPASPVVSSVYIRSTTGTQSVVIVEGD